MKRYFALLLTVLLACACVAGCAQAERMPASYVYALTEDGDYVENLIFNEEVVISGENSQIAFINCEFNKDIVVTSNEGTRVMLFGCDVNAACVLRGGVKEADINYSNPKILTDGPVSVVIEDCVGTVVALGDFEVTLNGETYSMADSEYFSDATAPEAGMVPYEGQEASYYGIGQWYENGEKQTLAFAEYDPEM